MTSCCQLRCVLLLFFLFANGEAHATEIVRISISRHKQVSLTNAEADQILQDMSDALQQLDTPQDVATDIEFVRHGNVKVLPDEVPAVINSKASFEAVRDAALGVKVIRRIEWCKESGSPYYGCAPIGSPDINFVVVRKSQSSFRKAEGILWAHEYGHNCRRQDRNVTRALMSFELDKRNNVVNHAESTAFLAGPSTATTFTGGQNYFATKSINQFVEPLYIHGIPRVALPQYEARDATVLIGMLKQISSAPNAPNKSQLANIAATLCGIGDSSAVSSLTATYQIESPSDAAYDAKHAVLVNLGYLIRRTADQEAIDFLFEVATNPEASLEVATNRNAELTKQPEIEAPSIVELQTELASSAILGLGLAASEFTEDLLLRITRIESANSQVRQLAATARASSIAIRENEVNAR